MEPRNVLAVKSREEFRAWLQEHHDKERECWVEAKRGKTPPDHGLWYLDAVEEALCFGWIDSTLKSVDGMPLQRFGPRSKSSQLTELNKERCRRLERLGLMTDHGRKVCPNLSAPFETLPEIVTTFEAYPEAWVNFRSFPLLYQRVRIDNIQRKITQRDLFASRRSFRHGRWPR